MLAKVADIAQDDELDRGTTSVAPGTERTCALTREPKPVSDMIRFVVGPAGEAVPDIKRKLPGRGLWIDATRTAIEESVWAQTAGLTSNKAASAASAVPTKFRVTRAS